MPAKMTAYKVMIASPSDVSEAREIVRKVIHEWNAIHSDDRKIVLMPVGWESHSSPEVGDRPQGIINKQILKGADLLIAVFWTRLGSPTGKAVSGTVEEIEEFIKAGKPVMIYFSNAPVVLGSVDQEQYKALLKFKDDLKNRGLYEEFDSAQTFREKLHRQLAQTVNRFFRQRKTTEKEEVIIPPRPQPPELSEEAKNLLIEASKDPSGTILFIRYDGGLGIQTNGRNLVEEQTPRRQARWKGAVEQLREARLIEDRSHQGEVFSVTEYGYRIADVLSEENAVPSVHA